jgi:dimethylhistidine N-methyltransferase
MSRSHIALRSARDAEGREEFAADVQSGLKNTPKRLKPKYFYDAAGSALFDRITELPEYYPTRSEIALLEVHAPAIAALFPPGCALVEFGGGSSRKARIVLGAAASVEAYVPIDISGDYLREDAARLRRDLAHLSVIPVVGDFTAMSEPPAEIASRPRAGFFPGSTIGNFEPAEAVALLRRAGRVLGAGAVLVIGVDLIKDRDTLQRAYSDAAGVTAQFNLNMLARINRELGADFDLSAFEHVAFYNEAAHRIEMHLRSRVRQTVRVLGAHIDFAEGETIHTENSYKYSVESFREIADKAGWSPRALWSDGLFSIHALSLAGRD